MCATVYGWCHLVKATEVTWHKVTYGLTAFTPGSAPGPTLGYEYAKTLSLHFTQLCTKQFYIRPSHWYHFVLTLFIAFDVCWSPQGVASVDINPVCSFLRHC